MYGVYILVALGALSCVNSLNAANTDCECAVFFNSDVDDRFKLFSATNTHISSCYDANDCKRSCAYTLESLNVNGDPKKITPQGLTVADYACKSYGKDIYNGQPAGYYKVCDGDWKHIKDSKFKLCCKDGSSVPC